ncbi:MAG TPA: septal ring lytic transglycosylase RlpA family protein [Saprospiraceae bacterium]|nr:septal ring lytic transglycosylase RlpA family protein [Saprospiraceae bacterium]HMQ84798.1 septal ring lytic transglycosylase RlpA family protein [Saprospiraceae bacterium]
MRRSIFLVLLTAAFLTSATSSFAQQDEEFGMASYYSDDFQGNKTAYGVKYDRNELTAAHKRHPFGTKLRITRLDNNKSVVVKVIDKGPYVKGRVVDISYAAAKQIGLLDAGVAEVKVELVSAPSKKDTKVEEKVTEIPKEVPTSFDTEASAKNKAESTKKTEEKTTTVGTDTDKSKGSSKARLVGNEFQQYGLYKISLEKPQGKGYSVQVASLTNYENVFRQVADLQAKWFDNIHISIEKGNDDKPIYKILLGTFDSEKAADAYRESLAKKHKIKGFVVNLTEIKY